MFRILLLLCLPFALFAQSEKNKLDFAPCGAPPGIDPWLLRYHDHPQDYASKGADTLWVALQIHLVAKNDGSGRYSYDRLLAAFCRLNTDYAQAGIQFYFKNPVNLIDNTTWYAHNSIPTGIEMMLTNNVPDALNIYFVQDPAGNCGYNLPYAGIAMNNTCAGPNDHTWAHEIGHALSLPHPFIGWEGKTYNYNLPTPELLTYDYTYFHDTLETTVPAPLDTALVEYVDGHNCTTAADLFCDTKPDYLSYRWTCNAQNTSTGKLKDPNGAEFYADGTLFMSYANDQCQNRFSDEQIAAMRANLYSEKLAWLSTLAPLPTVTEAPSDWLPENLTILPGVQTTLQWSAVPYATHYLVIGSRISSLAYQEFEAVTTDTTLLTPELVPNRKYYWKVRAFNDYSSCAPYSPTHNFTTGALSALEEPTLTNFRCYPVLLSKGASLQLECTDHMDEPIRQMLLVNALGQVVLQQSIQMVQGKAQVELPTTRWSPGMYQVLLLGASTPYVQRIILMP